MFLDLVQPDLKYCFTSFGLALAVWRFSMLIMILSLLRSYLHVILFSEPFTSHLHGWAGEVLSSCLHFLPVLLMSCLYGSITSVYLPKMSRILKCWHKDCIIFPTFGSPFTSLTAIRQKSHHVTFLLYLNFTSCPLPSQLIDEWYWSNDIMLLLLQWYAWM